MAPILRQLIQNPYVVGAANATVAGIQHVAFRQEEGGLIEVNPGLLTGVQIDAEFADKVQTARAHYTGISLEGLILSVLMPLFGCLLIVSVWWLVWNRVKDKYKLPLCCELVAYACGSRKHRRRKDVEEAFDPSKYTLRGCCCFIPLFARSGPKGPNEIELVRLPALAVRCSEDNGGEGSSRPRGFDNGGPGSGGLAFVGGDPLGGNPGTEGLVIREVPTAQPPMSMKKAKVRRHDSLTDIFGGEGASAPVQSSSRAECRRKDKGKHRMSGALPGPSIVFREVEPTTNQGIPSHPKQLSAVDCILAGPDSSDEEPEEEEEPQKKKFGLNMDGAKTLFRRMTRKKVVDRVNEPSVPKMSADKAALEALAAQSARQWVPIMGGKGMRWVGPQDDDNIINAAVNGMANPLPNAPPFLANEAVVSGAIPVTTSSHSPSETQTRSELSGSSRAKTRSRGPASSASQYTSSAATTASSSVNQGQENRKPNTDYYPMQDLGSHERCQTLSSTASEMQEEATIPRVTEKKTEPIKKPFHGSSSKVTSISSSGTSATRDPTSFRSGERIVGQVVVDGNQHRSPLKQNDVAPLSSIASSEMSSAKNASNSAQLGSSKVQKQSRSNLAPIAHSSDTGSEESSEETIGDITSSIAVEVSERSQASQREPRTPVRQSTRLSVPNSPISSPHLSVNRPRSSHRGRSPVLVSNSNNATGLHDLLLPAVVKSESSRRSFGRPTSPLIRENSNFKPKNRIISSDTSFDTETYPSTSSDGVASSLNSGHGQPQPLAFPARRADGRISTVTSSTEASRARATSARMTVNEARPLFDEKEVVPGTSRPASRVGSPSSRPASRMGRDVNIVASGANSPPSVPPVEPLYSTTQLFGRLDAYERDINRYRTALEASRAEDLAILDALASTQAQGSMTPESLGRDMHARVSSPTPSEQTWGPKSAGQPSAGLTPAARGRRESEVRAKTPTRIPIRVSQVEKNTVHKEEEKKTDANEPWY